MRNHSVIRLCQARDLLRARHNEPIGVQVAAHEAGLSVYHFIRTFKSTFGQTPHSFIKQVRLEQAQRLLLTDNDSVTDVCFEVGYSSLGSFSASFTRFTGMPPSVYRQQMRSLVQIPGTFSTQLIPYCFAYMYGTKKRNSGEANPPLF